MVLEQVYIHMKKNKFYLILFTKSNSKWSIDLNEENYNTSKRKYRRNDLQS